MSTITLVVPPLAPSGLTTLESWLRQILWDSVLPLGAEKKSQTVPFFSVHRTKGRIFTTSLGVKMIQGVREVFEIVDLHTTKTPSPQTPDQAESQRGKLVLIGRGLQIESFQSSLDNSLSCGMGYMTAAHSQS